MRLLSVLISKSKPLEYSKDWEMLGHTSDAGIGVKVGSLRGDAGMQLCANFLFKTAFRLILKRCKACPPA